MIIAQGGSTPPISIIAELLYLILGILFAIPLMAYCRKKKWGGYAFDPLLYMLLIVFWPLWIILSILRISYLTMDFLSRKVESWF